MSSYLLLRAGFHKLMQSNCRLSETVCVSLPGQTRWHISTKMFNISAKMFNIYFKCSMNCSLPLAALTKRHEHFNEHFVMKRCQRRSKQIKYADSHDFAGFIRKIGVGHWNHENWAWSYRKWFFRGPNIGCRVVRHLKRINVNTWAQFLKSFH